MSSKKFDYTPMLKTKKDINVEVKKKIEEERTGKQLGLKTRFNKLNAAMGKYIRFSNVISINGLSGHGKSTLLNMLLQDFINKDLNKNFEQDVIIIHNSFEMLPVDEVMRNVSSKLEVSYMHLLSSEIKEDKTGYNRISDEELKDIDRALENDENQDHYYFEESTNIMGLTQNINKGIEFYQSKYNTKKIPKVVVALDHTLLVEAMEKEGVIDTMGRLGKWAIYLKKKGYLVVFVGQLNNEIEKPERLRNLDLQYPMKSDIYAQGQLYNACDIVLTIHQPELLGIVKYGKNQYNTAGLVHLQVIKQRAGKVGSIWLKNELDKGRLIQFEPSSELVA